MMFRQTSSGVSRRVRPMFRADAARFACDSGTIFGRAVVPEVCSTSAISPAVAGPGSAGVPARPSGGCKLKAPAASGSGANAITGMHCAAATARAGVSAPRGTISALAFRSDR
jgi:hypothetical protein